MKALMNPETRNELKQNIIGLDNRPGTSTAVSFSII